MENGNVIQGLPPHLSKEDVPEAEEGEELFRHTWLYSVVPVGNEYSYWDTPSNSYHVEFPLSAYLTGFCRQCGKVFSQKIATQSGEGYIETQTQVSQFGCVSPLAGL